MQTDENSVVAEPRNSLAPTPRELSRHREDNPEYIRMSKLFTDELVQLSQKSNPAMTVLMLFIGKMNEHNSVLISNETMERITKLSNSSIKRAVRVLREDGWIDIAKVGTSNIYRVNSDIFWQDTEAGRLAEFTANVVLSFDEQEDFMRLRTPGMTRNVPLVSAADYVGSARQSQQELPL